MDIIERPDVASALLEQARLSQPKRPEGFHQSDFNQCLRKSAMYHFLGRSLEDWTETTLLRMLRGTLKGSYLSQNQPELVFDSDNFGWCSVDRLWPDNLVRGAAAVDQTVMELKSTIRSSNRPINDSTNYFCQTATYVLKKARLDGWDILPWSTWHGFLYVVYERGDYKSPDPDHRAFELTWTGQELLDWEVELQRRRDAVMDSLDFLHIEAAAKNNEAFLFDVEKLKDRLPAEDGDAFLELLPPIEDHYGFECDAYGPCPVKELLGCPGRAEDSAWDKLPFQLVKEEYARVEGLASAKKKK